MKHKMTKFYLLYFFFHAETHKIKFYKGEGGRGEEDSKKE